MPQQHVKEPLSSLDPWKATGCDGISIQIAPSLSSLYNSCITQGKWPVDWKKGEWASVYKKTDIDFDENYRPITILNAVVKVFEKELSKQATNLFENK